MGIFSGVVDWETRVCTTWNLDTHNIIEKWVPSQVKQNFFFSFFAFYLKAFNSFFGWCLQIRFWGTNPPNIMFLSSIANSKSKAADDLQPFSW